MGNTIKIAEVTASQILQPNNPLYTSQYTHGHSYGDEIPEQCPMHRKSSTDLICLSEQCPILNDDGHGINPLNRVCIIILYLIGRHIASPEYVSK